MRMTGTVTSRLRLVDSGNLFFVLVLVLAPALPLLSLSSLLLSVLFFCPVCWSQVAAQLSCTAMINWFHPPTLCFDG